MHIKIAGRSVISVRTKRIVHGVESEAINRCDMSGKSGARAAAATFAAAHKTTMKSSNPDLSRPASQASTHFALPTAPGPPLYPPQPAAQAHPADRTPAYPPGKWPQGTAA